MRKNHINILVFGETGPEKIAVESYELRHTYTDRMLFVHRRAWKTKHGIHTEPRWWTVTDAETGLSTGAQGGTRKEAIEDFKRLEERVTREAWQAAIDQALAQHGVVNKVYA